MSHGPPGFFRGLWLLLFGWLSPRRESPFIDRKHTNLSAFQCLLTHLDRDLYHLGPKLYTDDFQQCRSFFENSVPTQPIPVLDPQQRQFVVSVLERISKDFKSNKKRYARLYAKKNYSPERAYWEARTRMLDYIIPEIRADNLKGILKSSDLSMLMLREGGPYPSPHKPAPPDESADNVFPPMTEREAYDKLLYFVSIDFPDQPLLDSWALLVSPRSPHNVIGPIAMRYNRAFLDIPDPLSDRRFMLVYMYIHLLSLNHVDATTIDTTAAEPRLVSFVRKREANPVSLITPTGTASGSNSSGSTTSVRTCLIQYLPRITHDISTRAFLDPATKDLRTSILNNADTLIAALSRVKLSDLRPIVLSHLGALVHIYADEIKADPAYPNVRLSIPLTHYRLLKYLHESLATGGIDAPITRDGLEAFLSDPKQCP